MPQHSLQDFSSVEELLQEMTLDEKVGQMTQVDRRYLFDVNDIHTYALGSLLSGGGSTPAVNEPAKWADMLDEYQALAAKSRLGIPLIYGIDAVHGHNNVVGATLIPHNIGLGATRNPELVEELAAMTAREVRATGINWTFAPCVANSRDERWGRAYESFGEDPQLIADLGAAQVRGFQRGGLSHPEAIAACTKHYVGDGGPIWGTGLHGKIDRGDTRINEAELREVHMKPYIHALNAGTATIMASYSLWNGLHMHAHKYLMTDVLKGELGFEGFIVSDWAAIDSIPGDYKSDIVTSINAGIDMVMVPGDTMKNGHSYREFIELLTESVEDGSIPMSRIDDAVTRILKIKEEMGLLSQPYHNDRKLLNTVGSAEHRTLARQAVRESVVLLKNQEQTLPLKKDLAKLVVTGRGADDMGMLCGGWTISWQGWHGEPTPGTTVLEGVQTQVSAQTEIHSGKSGEFPDDADAIIVVIGESPYAEMVGDDDDLSLSKKDITAVRDAAATGLPTIVVLLSGRPMILDYILPEADAILAAWLPGTEGGDGIADILFGEYAPTGKLPVSWPASMDQIPINLGDEEYEPLFQYGFGLTYE